jgi:hypothetical protein
LTSLYAYEYIAAMQGGVALFRREEVESFQSADRGGVCARSGHQEYEQESNEEGE